ncbi:MAG: hypothetical protein ACRDO0_07005 [Nocardioidaceae bacterium]
MTTTPMNTTRQSPHEESRTTVRWWFLVRHYVEMVLAMMVGMVVLGAVRDALGWTVPFAEHPGASFLLMATDMAIGMVVWMRIRRHRWPGTLEMSAVMYVPAVLLPLVWTGLLGSMTFMMVAHVLMFLAMGAVLLRRRNEYAHC